MMRYLVESGVDVTGELGDVVLETAAPWTLSATDRVGWYRGLVFHDGIEQKRKNRPVLRPKTIGNEGFHVDSMGMGICQSDISSDIDKWDSNSRLPESPVAVQNSSPWH